ncbi:hypothetical protein AMTR_s00019p00134190 [Amborella trichopoda]|uniref:Uncharacterized protein n=1 Tax=Amborella trichopoda TaxID=13333 RepID=W1PB58_AMBTC|nr:hypothetical protein AMTR_s00019p00134190 [Amborella trichopoda]
MAGLRARLGIRAKTSNWAEVMAMAPISLKASMHLLSKVRPEETMNGSTIRAMAMGYRNSDRHSRRNFNG